MARIDRAMYFVNKNSNKSSSNLVEVAHQFFIYWKLLNMYGFSTKAINAEQIFDGFTQLLDYNERRCAKDLYVNNEVTVNADVEIEFEVYNLNVQQNGVQVDNLNNVAFTDEEFEIDEDIFRDELDDQAREMEWYVESSDNDIDWDDIESDLVSPTEDNTLVYMYDLDMDIHSSDVEAFVATEVEVIYKNNADMTDDAYKSFMLRALQAQMERRNAPEEETTTS